MSRIYTPQVKPLNELIELIEDRGKAASSDSKIIWQVLWVMAQHLSTLKPTSDPVQELISNTQTLIERENAKVVLPLLNKLKAAPGQPNRTMITHYLMSRGWISGTQEPEAWPLEHVPASAGDMAKLVEAVSRFEAESKGVTP